ncbi:MAG: branched-chain amino acid transaminase [Rhodothermales bacterium]|nr:branched-chain amino acid transaminase [Rhodothermales bacterium]
MQKHDIWFNGEFVPFDEANVHVLSHVLHYGSSVFEGVRCYNTEEKGPAIFRLRDHTQRLIDSARIYRMEVPYDLETLEEAQLSTISRSGLEACYIRPLVFRGMGPMGVNPLNNPVETIIAVWEWGAYLGKEALEEGVDVEVASWQRMAPNTFPAMAKAGGNYLNASLVKMNAILNGYTEGIMLSKDGHVAEGSGENLFMVKSGRIYTAPSSLSILPGITRASIMRLADQMGYTVETANIPREALYIADELFFTGTAAEVTPIKSVDNYVIGSGSRGPVTKAIQDAYFDVVHRGIDPFGWLTPVEVAAPAPTA